MLPSNDVLDSAVTPNDIVSVLLSDHLVSRVGGGQIEKPLPFYTTSNKTPTLHRVYKKSIFDKPMQMQFLPRSIIRFGVTCGRETDRHDIRGRRRISHKK